jgi:hypothetical protein
MNRVFGEIFATIRGAAKACRSEDRYRMSDAGKRTPRRVAAIDAPKPGYLRGQGPELPTSFSDAHLEARATRAVAPSMLAALRPLALEDAKVQRHLPMSAAIFKREHGASAGRAITIGSSAN